MPTRRFPGHRAFTATVAAALLALVAAAPASADPDPQNPRVGGDSLYQSGLQIDPSASPLPQPGAKSFIVADLDSGEILAAQNAHQPLPPASTLKMLTALTVLPRVDLDTIYTAVHEDAAVEGTRVGIVPGSTYTGRQLFEGMFLISGNDAANAVANLNGGIEGTVAQMQAEAGRVQAYETVPRSANGLDEPGQVSSAYDLALIARAGMARDDFREFAGTANSTFPKEGTEDPLTRPTFEIWNQNKLVTGGFDGAIGVKSGYTTNAGRTFASAAERDGRRYLVTLMGIEGNTYDTGGAFLEWAFANGQKVHPVGTLVEPKFATVQSDAAVVVEQGAVGAGFAGMKPHAGVVTFWIAVITLGAGAVLWWRLRAPYRRATRLRSRPAATAPRDQGPQYIDLRRDTDQSLHV